MDDVERYLIEFADQSKHLTCDQIIIGGKKHSRLINNNTAIPGYIKKFPETHIFPEIACVVGGKCLINIENKTYLLGSRNVCFVNAIDRHFESFFKENLGYEMIWIFFQSAFQLKIINTSYEPALKDLKLISSITMKIKPEMVYYLSKIFAINDPEKEIVAVKEIVLKWFEFIKNNIKSKNYRKRIMSRKNMEEFCLKAKRMEKALKYVKIHYKENISLENVSAKAGLSPAYFSSLMRKVYNESLSEMITKLRLKDACLMLGKSESSISEIAFKVGYEDPFFFSRVFKKYIGISPKEYRKKVLQFNYYPVC